MIGPQAIGGRHFEGVVLAGNPVHFFVLVDIQAIVLGDLAVVLQRLGAIRLLIQTRHRDVADFEQLRRREEGHIGGIVINRIHHAPLLDQHRLHAALLEFDPAREAGRSRPHHQCVEPLRHLYNFPSTFLYTASSAASSAAAFLPPASAMSGRPPPFPPTASPTALASLPAWTFAVRSLVTAEIIETLPSSALASTTTADFHLLRSASASARICGRSIPSSRAATTLTSPKLRACASTCPAAA